jgi:hypothetical protein
MLPFCKQMLDEGLGCGDILREYDFISRYQSKSFHRLDQELHMICLRGYNTHIGLSLHISDGSYHSGKLEAEITFDVEQFVRYYMPTTNSSSCFSIGSMPRETFDQLLDVELNIGAVRRKKWFGLRNPLPSISSDYFIFHRR